MRTNIFAAYGRLLWSHPSHDALLQALNRILTEQHFDAEILLPVIVRHSLLVKGSDVNLLHDAIHVI